MRRALCSLLCLLLVTGCRHVQEERFPADVRINGKPVHFAYDTGAFDTILFARAAKRQGLKVSKPPASPKPAPGKVKTGQTELCQLTVGHESYRLKLSTVHLGWPWGSLMDLDGVIGWQNLKDDFLVIDAARDAIRGVDALPQDTNGWTRLPLYRRCDVLALEIPRADGKTGVLGVDTGNSEGVSLSPARWKEWRATHPHRHGGWLFNFMPGSGPGIGRHYKADDLAIGPLNWKCITIRKARRTETSLAKEGDVFEASIGIAALRQLNLIIDRTNHMAYVRRDPNWTPEKELEHRKALGRAPPPARSNVRLDLREHEYWDLAVDALDSGKPEVAVTNATLLLALQPESAGALAVRGIALFRMQFGQGSVTNPAPVLCDVSRALKLDADLTPLYNVRGHLYYLTQQWDGALQDFQHFCDKVPREANYPRFFLWLIRARKGQPAEADRELAAWFGPGGKAKASRWERKIGAFLLGRMTESEFLSAAGRGKDSGRQCEGWFYAAMKRLLAGDTATARAYFQKCLATDRKDFDEYNFAAAELKLLQ